MIKVYCDGSCIGNPGPGGWAFLIDVGQITTIKSGKLDYTTNQRAEITAAIKGLQYMRHHLEDVLMLTDSQYVVKTMNGQFKQKANLDLWRELQNALNEVYSVVRWEHVKGHAGNTNQEIVDKLAKREAEDTAKGPQKTEPSSTNNLRPFEYNQCVCCLNETDGTYGKEFPVCIQCYGDGTLRQVLDETDSEWILFTP